MTKKGTLEKDREIVKGLKKSGLDNLKGAIKKFAPPKERGELLKMAGRMDIEPHLIVL